MDVRRVLTYRAVARRRSFSQAARDLLLSQPSVSNQVAALEREIGTRLLERRPGGLELTPAGAILLDHADAIAERLGLAERQLGELAGGERVRLRVGAFPTALAGYLPAAIERLRETHPDAEVTVDESASADLPDRVRTGRVHLAISFHEAGRPPGDLAGLERRDLLRERFLVALPPDHRLAHRDAVRIADLARDDWTAASTDGLIARACRDAGFEPHLISITRDQLAIRGLILRGLAVSLAPELLADAFADLALRRIAGRGPEREVYALLPPGGRHPLVAPLLGALDAEAAALQAQPA